MSKTINKITDVQPQAQNANKHTQRGLGLLEDSIQKDGWIGAITVAADGETFDGSARVEVGAGAGFEEAIVVESDGSKPVIVKRVDIATADDPRAKRLGIAANRIAQIDLNWDPDVLKANALEGVEIGDLWNDAEMQAEIERAAREVQAFIPHLNPSSADALLTTEADFEKAKEKLREQIHREVKQRPLNCPHCGQQFYLNEDAFS